MKLITKETLKKWNACESGYKTFRKLLPNGATLQDAGKALITSDHADYANWLWGNAKEDDDYVDQTVVASVNYGTATAGDYGTATAGDCGCIAIRNQNSPYQMVCASVDGDKVKPNTPYKLDDYGNFVEATQCAK